MQTDTSAYPPVPVHRAVDLDSVSICDIRNFPPTLQNTDIQEKFLHFRAIRAVDAEQISWNGYVSAASAGKLGQQRPLASQQWPCESLYIPAEKALGWIGPVLPLRETDWDRLRLLPFSRRAQNNVQLPALTVRGRTAEECLGSMQSKHDWQK